MSDLDDLMPRLPGDSARLPVFGRFEAIEPIAEGGQAVVYHAVDPATGLQVAVKWSRDHGDRLSHEAELLRACDSLPAVVELVEHGVADGRVWLATRWLEGEGFPVRATPWAELRPLVDALLTALAQLHDAGVVHRDLKPDNVRVVDGAVVLIDLGLARRKGSARRTRRDVVVGSTAWMSPERLRGEPGDATADLYAVGVMICEAMTGALPWLTEVAHPRATPRLPPGPPHVRRELARMLALAPGDRPRSALEARRALMEEVTARPRWPMAVVAAIGVASVPLWWASFLGQPAAAVEVEAGGRHTCVLDEDGRVHCWGEDFTHGAGPGSATYRTLAAGLGFGHSCAVRTDGALHCWGDPEHPVVRDVPEGSTWEHVASGQQHSCALDERGQIACWGDDVGGETIAPVGEGYLDVCAGYFHSCALTEEGTVFCWGGDDTSTQLPYTPAGPKYGYSDLVCGIGHTCATRREGGITCWTIQTEGGPDLRRPLLPPLLEVSAGGMHNCAIEPSDRAVCWGDDRRGQVSGATKDDVRDVAAGDWHSCAVHRDGTVGCWGKPGPQIEVPERFKR